MHRKSLLVVLIFLIAITLSWAAEAIQFECPILEESVRKAKGYTGAETGPIYPVDVLEIEAFDVVQYFSSSQIISLEGIQYLINLEKLTFSTKNVNDLTPLQNLTNLQVLMFTGSNQTIDLTPIQNLKNLRYLYFQHALVINLTPLQNLINLEELFFGWNQVTDLTPLQNLKNLQKLDFQENQVWDLSPLLNLANLEYLRFWGNQVSDISPLVANTGLGEGAFVVMLENTLDLTEGSQNMNDIKTLIQRGVDVRYEPQNPPQPIQFECLNLEEGIRKAKGYTGAETGPIYPKDVLGIEVLDVSNAEIPSLEGIQYLTHLLQLSFEDNIVSDLTPLQNLRNLQELHFKGNQVSDISPLQNLTNLQRLSFWVNQVSDLTPLQNLTNLQELVFSWNQVSDLTPLENLTNLQRLVFHNNQASDLTSLQNLTSLQGLFFSDNQIISITPLVANTGLGAGDDIDMRYNHLDLTPGSQHMNDINTLIGRGVIVTYEPQN